MNDNYNDGVVYIMKNNATPNSFKSRPNVTSKEEMKKINHFFFKEESLRQQDILFADSQDRTLSVKISIPYCSNIQNDYLAIIDNHLYSIFHSDSDRVKEKTYLYLEGMRDLER